MKRRTLPKAAQPLWKRVSSEDTWGCEYVYEYGARRIWDAAIRYEHKRLSLLLGIRHFPKHIRKRP